MKSALAQPPSYEERLDYSSTTAQLEKKKIATVKQLSAFICTFFLYFLSLFICLRLCTATFFFPLILNGLKINSEHKDLGLQYLSFECECINVQGFFFWFFLCVSDHIQVFLSLCVMGNRA